MEQTETLHQIFCTKTCFSTTKKNFFLSTKQARNWFTQKMFKYKIYLKPKRIIIRSLSHIMSATKGGGAVVSKCRKMDMNEYQNIFGCHIFQ